MRAQEILKAFEDHYDDIRQAMIDFVKEHCKEKSQVDLYWHPQSNNFDWFYNVDGNSWKEDEHIRIASIPEGYYSDSDLAPEEIAEAYQEWALDNDLNQLEDSLRESADEEKAYEDWEKEQSKDHLKDSKDSRLFVAVYGYSFDSEKHATVFETFEDAFSYVQNMAQEEYMQIQSAGDDDWTYTIETDNNNPTAEIKITTVGTDAAGKDFTNTEWYIIAPID